jgi:hypothetical protein
MSFVGDEGNVKTDMQAWLGPAGNLCEGLGWAAKAKVKRRSQSQSEFAVY